MPARLKVTQEHLLDTAARLFAERGFDGTSITDLLTELDLARPTLYTKTRGKQELLAAIQDRLIATYKAAMPGHVRPSDPPLRRIRGFIELQLEVCARHRESMVLMSRRPFLEADRDPDLVAWWRELDAILLRAITDAQAGGELPADVEPRFIAHSVWATVNDLPYWYRPDGRLSASQLAAQLIRLLSGGRG